MSDDADSESSRDSDYWEDLQETESPIAVIWPWEGGHRPGSVREHTDRGKPYHYFRAELHYLKNGYQKSFTIKPHLDLAKIRAEAEAWLEQKRDDLGIPYRNQYRVIELVDGEKYCEMKLSNCDDTCYFSMEDLDMMRQHVWCGDTKGSTKYMATRESDIVKHAHTFLLADELAKAKATNPDVLYEIDHRDGNGLNNRRENIHVVTRLQNKLNHKRQRNNTSGYNGVSWDTRDTGWCASWNESGKHKSKVFYVKDGQGREGPDGRRAFEAAKAVRKAADKRLRYTVRGNVA
jgi:hypothetical protein